MCRAQTDATGSGTASGIHYLLYLRVKWQLTAAPRRNLFIPGRHIYSIVISSIRFGRCICVTVNGAKFIANRDLRSPSDWSWESVIHTANEREHMARDSTWWRVIPYQLHYCSPLWNAQWEEKNRIFRSSWSANVHYGSEMRAPFTGRFCHTHTHTHTWKCVRWLRMLCKYFM